MEWRREATGSWLGHGYGGRVRPSAKHEGAWDAYTTCHHCYPAWRFSTHATRELAEMAVEERLHMHDAIGQVEVRFGSAPGASLSVDYIGEMSTVEGSREGTIREWSTIWVRITKARADGTKAVRFLRLVPGAKHRTVAASDMLRVAGRFDVAERINNPRRAADAWKARHDHR